MPGVTVRILVGDSAEVLRGLPENSVDAVVCDPPYGLFFMGKQWDYDVPSIEIWTGCRRVLKPGGYLISFGGTRTYHRLATRIEDAGFTLHPLIGWLFGQGFPKASRVKLPDMDGWRYGLQSLKPALEPIAMAQKPFSEKTGTENMARWGTGALNIDGCRVEGEKPATTRGAGGQHGAYSPLCAQGRIEDDGKGRWPANVIHSGDDEVTSLFPADKQGSAARFFYCAKASRSERNAGLEGRNKHETVKPIALMRYLCRLVTPPGGTVLDPFMGSGSTGCAAVQEGFEFIGIELDPEYASIAEARIAYWQAVAERPPEAENLDLFAVAAE